MYSFISHKWWRKLKKPPHCITSISDPPLLLCSVYWLLHPSPLWLLQAKLNLNCTSHQPSSYHIINTFLLSAHQIYPTQNTQVLHMHKYDNKEFWLFCYLLGNTKPISAIFSSDRSSRRGNLVHVCVWYSSNNEV